MIAFWVSANCRCKLFSRRPGNPSLRAQSARLKNETFTPQIDKNHETNHATREVVLIWPGVSMG